MPTPLPPIARIAISIHEVAVQVEYSGVYPDLLDDVTNRAHALMDSMLHKAREMKIDIRAVELSDYDSALIEDDREEDEDEEA